MSLSIRQLGPGFVAEVEGLDAREPITDETARALHAGMDEFAVLVIHGARLSAQQQLDFSRILGELEHTGHTGLRAPEDYRLPPVFADGYNLDKHERPYPRTDRRRLFAIGDRLWHSDSSFKVVPAKYSILHALRIPATGGDTEFADMRAAYDALDEETRTLVEDLVCVHSQAYSRQQIGFFDLTEEECRRFAPVRQRLLRVHPVNRRRSLYLSSHAGGIVGWPVPEARIFLRDLIEHATQRAFVYRHARTPGDLVIWDNRQTMHRGRPYPADAVRDMRRTTLAGDGPTAVQAACTPMEGPVP